MSEKTRPLSEHFARIYSLKTEAPDLLLKKICELGNTLETARQNPIKNQKAITFYESILATMKFAWGYMEDLEWLHAKAQRLERENQFLDTQNRHLTESLMKYKIIEDLKVSGEFDYVVSQVDEYLKHRNPDATNEK